MTNAKWLIAVIGFAVLGCAPNETGILAASKTGTLLQPALREHPLLAVRAACGDPQAAGASIARHPYLQSVTSSGARLMWTSTASQPETVALWAGGEEATSMRNAQIDDTRYLVGANQVAAQLDSLEPNAIYCYELRDASGERIYGPAGFRTAPSADTDERIDMVLFGDSGFASSDQAAVAAQLETVPIDLMLHVGDLAYDTGTIAEFETNHFGMYRALMPSLPFFPTIGDHDDATEAAGPYREAFALPDMGGERYYSFDWGPVHVLVLDSIRDTEEQLAFAESDLSASDAPWKIAMVSEPPYSSGFHGSATDVRQRYSPLFSRYGVSAVFSGDDHDYERSNPIDGVTYVVTGGGGRSVRPVGVSDFTAFSEKVFHFIYLTVEGDVMRIRAIDATGREFDGAEITRT